MSLTKCRANKPKDSAWSIVGEENNIYKNNTHCLLDRTSHAKVTFAKACSTKFKYMPILE